MAEDLLFNRRDWMFSCRVGALIYRDGKILLQQAAGDAGYAIPGGHVAFGEFTDETLAREILEETGAAVRIGRLCAVCELFWRWKKPCHQLNFYYLAYLQDPGALLQERFYAFDALGNERIELEFCWIPVEQISRLRVYPQCLKPYLAHPPTSVLHLQENDLL